MNTQPTPMTSPPDKPRDLSSKVADMCMRNLEYEEDSILQGIEAGVDRLNAKRAALGIKPEDLKRRPR